MMAHLSRIKNHEENRRCVCFGCCDKDLSLSESLQLLVKDFIDEGFDPNVNGFPIGLCTKCKAALYNKKVGLVSITPYRYV